MLKLSEGQMQMVMDVARNSKYLSKSEKEIFDKALKSPVFRHRVHILRLQERVYHRKWIADNQDLVKKNGLTEEQREMVSEYKTEGLRLQ